MNYSLLILIVLFICSLIPTIITLLITEKVKGSIKNSFDQKLESLKKKHTIEISKVESELNALKIKENFKFTKLHEKRMEVLEFSYKYLNKALYDLNQLVIPLKQFSNDTTFEENEKILFENFQNSQNQFAGYYSDNKIYFSAELELLIDTYNSETIVIYNDYYENYFMKQVSGEFNKEIHLKAAVAYKKIEEKIIPIKKEIEKKFKEVLER
ncbi:hypothetical protein [Myroides odoratus]|uniref:hypothetical protein n=1 Tax=Myroides odoratus TaxID=256 RepID=UPI003341192E